MTEWIEYTVGILIIVSALVVLIASVGIVRFKHLYARMHVVTKVSSFGLLLLLIALNLLSLKWRVFIESLIIFHVLIFLSPISAHVTAKVALWLNENPPEPDKEVEQTKKKESE
ncbi:monovalent cation/H(+) antiporter subunit G [Geofilum rubicundum]|uniref:Na(+) H(+) antiporter subunit G n=1 Tax=Geofilum rubicundum JCM 15548 TaxID=1236989 RepID=A0A0E9M1S0_9BACT|nr:monovalent cation/H(+) antiporter subunit G [Geofilum rubicundum]GAO31326.1 Na(+) H(+) antiporter subunit G [Geofilum rubicundum JCM 15548]